MSNQKINIDGLEIQAEVYDRECSDDGDEEYGVVEIAEGVFVKVIHPTDDFDDQKWAAYAVERMDTP
jgi:hypothetical protein